MMTNDPLFSLGAWQIAGLLLVSAILALGVIALARRLMRGRGIGLRILLAVAVFWLFLWLAPQVYHLSGHVVTGGDGAALAPAWPPGPERVLRRLTFTGPATIAAWSQGLLGWALVLLALHPRVLNRLF